MTLLTPPEIAELLAPYLAHKAPETLCEQIAKYLSLLERWNGRVSLTAVRDPAKVVQRHFGESLYLAEKIGGFSTLLDLGSGAGFPGIPVAMVRPASRITLAESQQKKVAFLREAVWSLGLTTQVWGKRVEEMPTSEIFEVVALRAVDNMESALEAAILRVQQGGRVVFFQGEGTPVPVSLSTCRLTAEHTVPLSSGKLIVAERD